MGSRNISVRSCHRNFNTSRSNWWLLGILTGSEVLPKFQYQQVKLMVGKPVGVAVRVAHFNTSRSNWWRFYHLHHTFLKLISIPAGQIDGILPALHVGTLKRISIPAGQIDGSTRNILPPIWLLNFNTSRSNWWAQPFLLLPIMPFAISIPAGQIDGLGQTWVPVGKK